MHSGSTNVYKMTDAKDPARRSARFLWRCGGCRKQDTVRLTMQTGTFKKLSGHVEADESYIGGNSRNMHNDRRDKTIKGTGGAGKTAVIGLLERHGEEKKRSRVVTKVVSDTRVKTLQPIVRDHVEPGSHISTDALAS